MSLSLLSSPFLSLSSHSLSLTLQVAGRSPFRLSYLPCLIYHPILASPRLPPSYLTIYALHVVFIVSPDFTLYLSVLLDILNSYFFFFLGLRACFGVPPPYRHPRFKKRNNVLLPASLPSPPLPCRPDIPGRNYVALQRCPVRRLLLRFLYPLCQFHRPPKAPKRCRSLQARKGER